MSPVLRNRRFRLPAAAAVVALTLGALTVSFVPAKAQVPYFGFDFGNGVGIGLGMPPSAYDMAPASPVYPFYPPYYYPPRPYYYRY